MKLWIWFALAGILLFGCAGAPATLPAPATLQPLTVFHPPALRWMAPEMARCAQEIPGLALYRTEVIDPQEVQAGEALFWWGSAPKGKERGLNKYPVSMPEKWLISDSYLTSVPNYIYQVGEDVLQVVVHAKRIGATLSTDELLALFEGNETHWSDGAPVQVWIYPTSDSLWQAFATALEISAPASDAFLAPDPQAMLEAVADQPDAIGILPASWVEPNQPIAVVETNEKLTNALRQPITVAFSDEPKGASKSWMLCIQLSKP